MANEGYIYSNRHEWTQIISKMTFAVFKGIIAYLSNSKALLADALYSASDAANGIAERMPWSGHNKRKVNTNHNSEPIFAVLFSILIMMSGLHVALSAIRGLLQDELPAPKPFALIAVVVSIIANEVLFRYQYHQAMNMGKEKQLLYAKIHRYTLFTSSFVLFGIVGAMIGSILDLPVLFYLDPAAALVASLFIVRNGYRLIESLLYNTHVQKTHDEDTTQYIDTVQRVHGVITVDDLKITEQGQYVTIDLKISVNPRISVLEAHDIATRVKNLLMNRFVHVSDVHVGVLPYHSGYPYKSNYELPDRDTSTILQ
ncbi:cation diffusion facilitator family transporter [Paenibacillus sediminis]|uniref:Cation diffusion facilitator family transporter n=1 Tax=Paenibacillus sediminis TaxID=664909 RepID=A0ABS4GY13_9BACL|nr:cation diffusion facilitator family transporter [Paenibacillus sediminis]MBP1935159.1 cation diffusion facilitator family transporter [Paenibacillus sediminis]